MKSDDVESFVIERPRDETIPRVPRTDEEKKEENIERPKRTRKKPQKLNL